MTYNRSKTSQNFYPWNRNNNCLLLKDDIGRAKYSSYNLPTVDFSYGKPLTRDDEGAKEVSMTWKFHKDTIDKQAERDFVALNKMMNTQGVVGAKNQGQFRCDVDARLKIHKGRNALPLYIPEEQFRYGKANRPSTPMKLVLGNCYGLEYQQRLEHDYQMITESEKYKPKLTVRDNKASQLSQSYNRTRIDQISKKGNKDLFKLTKFKNVGNRTDTNNCGKLTARLPEVNNAPEANNEVPDEAC